MEKMNISIFLNYKKSKNLFLLLKRFWKCSLLKWKLRKQYKIRTFKNNYHIFHSTNKQVHRYFCLSENDVSIVIVEEETMEASSKFILELKSFSNKVVLLIDGRQKINIEEIRKYPQILIVGMNNENINNLNKIIELEEQKNTWITEKIYPLIVEEQLEEIEQLFPLSINEKRKRFLTLQLFSKDFSFIDEILNMYHIDKYTYFRRKQELIEYGYAPEYLSELYSKFYEKQYQIIKEYKK